MAASIVTVNDRLGVLKRRHRRIHDQIAPLRLLAIALSVREALPGAATVGFAWSDDGFSLTLDGFYTADGDEIGSSAGPLWGRLVSEVNGLCFGLDEDNVDGWSRHVDSEMRLRIEEALDIREPEGDDTPAPGSPPINPAHTLTFDPDTAAGRAICELFAHIKTYIEHSDGGWPGGDVCEYLTGWLTDLGFTIDEPLTTDAGTG